MGREVSVVLTKWAVVVLVALAPTAPAVAQSGGTSDVPVQVQPGGSAEAPAERGPYTRHPEALRAIGQLKSPYCPGFMLEVCSSAAGAALRDSIDALAVAGWDADEIVDWMLAEYGEEYLALPRREGKALVAWVVPPLAVFLGFAVVIVALRSMRGSRPPRVTRDDISDEEEERLRSALAELDAEEEAPFL